ncbi:MAG: DUF445 domain-containing protein [Candidatus Baldrarchaeia archaeon]
MFWVLVPVLIEGIGVTALKFVEIFLVLGNTSANDSNPRDAMALRLFKVLVIVLGVFVFCMFLYISGAGVAFLEMGLLPKLLIGMFFGAFIGYSANRVAIWMLFHPARPINLGPFKIQGIIPKRKRMLGERLADLVARDFLSGGEIVQIVETAQRTALRRMISDRISTLPLPRGMREGLVDFLCGIISEITKRYLEGLKDHIDVRSFIIQKIESVSDEDFDRIFKEAVGRELKYISINDALLGAIVGIVEILVLGTILH